VENYLHNWDVKELHVLDALVSTWTGFKTSEKHGIILRSDYQPCLVDMPGAPADLDMELTELTEESILNSLHDRKNTPL
jgi:hypothetical protein